MPLLLVLLLFLSCSSPSSPDWQEVPDRTGHPLYRLAVPTEWERIDPDGPIDDSRLPNVTFERDGITLVIHTFDHPIPPQAQVDRWINQSGEGEVTPASFGGYVGLRYEANGVIAWAMATPEINYTIKVTGEVIPFRGEIERIARSMSP